MVTRITNRDQDWRSKTKSGGWQQVRSALRKFEGTVQSAEWGSWGSDRDFIEIISVDNIPLTVTETLEMDIAQNFSFRINYSEARSSFFVADFLEAADKLKLVIPDDLPGKRIVWEKVRREAKDPKYSTENFIPVGVLDTPMRTGSVSEPVPASASNGMDEITELLEMAVGKTERQFRTAASLNPRFASSPILPLIKMGSVTDSLVKEGKLTLDGEVYQKV